MLPGLDENKNALCPEVISKERLLIESEFNEYTFAAQYQQNPIPAGGGLFKTEWFDILDLEPDIITTFIVIDTAETEKTINDATVLSFFGIYKIKEFGEDTDLYAIHFLDCEEIWIEPHQLEDRVNQFISNCMRHKVKPEMVAVEKKSTGVTLVSNLKKNRGIRVIEIERNVSSGSKTQRFIDSQKFLSRKVLTFPINGYHTENCIKHLSKITANNSHSRDDIADTVADAVRMTFVDKTCLLSIRINESREAEVMKAFSHEHQKITHARSNLWQ
jgi:phage terminase large subunit-like protein